MTKKVNEAQALMQGIYDSGDSLKQETKQSWDDLKSIYHSCAEALVVANNSVVQLFKVPGVIEHVPNRQETKISILGLDKDIKFFSEELKNIYKLHEGKTGLIDDENDLSACLQIFEMYHNFQSRYQSVIIPSVLVISEEVGKAAEAMRATIEANKLTDEQNPNVITEVEVKEPKDQSNV